jgi:hypothetical protein
MIYLNFAQVDRLDCQNPNDQRRTAFLHATHSDYNSIYIVDEAPLSMVDNPHDRFLVPSPQLRTNATEQATQKYLSHGTVRRARSLVLGDHELLDVYAFEEHHIPFKLRSPVEADLGKFGVSWDHPDSNAEDAPQSDGQNGYLGRQPTQQVDAPEQNGKNEEIPRTHLDIDESCATTKR